jgi:hypothetical protein
MKYIGEKVGSSEILQICFGRGSATFRNVAQSVELTARPPPSVSSAHLFTNQNHLPIEFGVIQSETKFAQKFPIV